MLWPIDRATIALVWSDGGLPGAAAAYRNYHELTDHHHHVWRNDGAPYDHGGRSSRRAPTPRDFVARVRERVAAGGVCVCALDTELLGHWWYEGVHWLEAVLDEAARQGLRADDARRRARAPRAGARTAQSSRHAAGARAVTCAPGAARRSRTWPGRRGRRSCASSRRVSEASERALRELLALQSSDWAFLVTEELAGDYPRERAAAHLRGARAGARR